MKKTILKRGAIVGCIGLGMLALSGCSTLNNSHHDTFNNNYTYHATPQTMHDNQHQKTFSVDYYDAHSNESANDMLDNDVNSYLNSIRNLKDYDWTTQTSPVGDDGDNKEEQVLTEHVILKHKPAKSATK